MLKVVTENGKEKSQLGDLGIENVKEIIVQGSELLKQYEKLVSEKHAIKEDKLKNNTDLRVLEVLENEYKLNDMLEFIGNEQIQRKQKQQEMLKEKNRNKLRGSKSMLTMLPTHSDKKKRGAEQSSKRRLKILNAEFKRGNKLT
eukprot:TRINITY_DN14940_c0_g1_i3.p2 TRINITY_DN14940_c0_g1~~TRINITY_DN14940_c0_g1_i3.p2  ORF type:complete len:144 (+),score=25.18 TRINITY_DN14940_c0_g1_i3:483-914(+)